MILYLGRPHITRMLMGLHAPSGVLAEHVKQLLFYSTFALFPFLWGEDRGEIFDGDCSLSHNSGCDFALILL